MTKIATRLNKVGNVLKHEYAPEQVFCREVASFAGGVLVTPSLANGTGDQVGLVVVNESGTWAVITEAKMAAFPATAGDYLGVIVDDQIEELDLTAAVDIAVLVDGPSIVRKGGLLIENVTTSAQELYDQLKAQNIKVADKYSTFA